MSTAGRPPLATELLRALEGHEWLVEPLPDTQVSTLGHFHPRLPQNLMVVGEAGAEWLRASGDGDRRSGLAQLCAGGLAVLIEAAGCHTAVPAAEARAHGLGLGRTRQSSHEAVFVLRRALVEALAPTTLVHGVLLRVFGLGVLLTGASGTGKSELALELLTRGQALVADDAVELRRLPGPLLEGSSPPLLSGFMEVRGLGVLDARALFGSQAICPRTRVDLVLDLQRDPPRGPDAGPRRLHGRRATRSWLGVALAQITIPIGMGHNPATLVEAACRDHWLRLRGHRADLDLARRQRAAVDRQTGP